MSSQSSGVALGLRSQPGSSSALPGRRNSLSALHLLPARSRSLALLGQEGFLESFRGTFHKTSSPLGTNRLAGNCSIPDPQLVQRIVAQVEFYFSDENLAKDTFLLKHIQKNKMGFVSIKLLTSFKKVKFLTRDWRLTLYALQFSELLEVNDEGTKVRRRVPIPESLLSIPPSRMLLAWELLPQEQEVLPPLQKKFLETITRMFSPFGAIASIRILRPGRKLPSDVRKYASRFPELLSKCCVLVEYESLESAHRAFEDLGCQSRPDGKSIRVVQLRGKGSNKKPEAEKGMEEEEQLSWKAQTATVTFPCGIGDSLLRSSLHVDGVPASPPSHPSKEPWASTWPTSDVELGDFNTFTGSRVASEAFPPLGANLGMGSCYSLWSSSESLCGWERGTGSWALWPHSPSPPAKPPPAAPSATKPGTESLGLQDGVFRFPRGPDGTKSLRSGFGRGELILQH